MTRYKYEDERGRRTSVHEYHHSDPGCSEAQWCGHRETDEVDILRAFPVVGDNTVGSLRPRHKEAGKKAGK